MVHLIFAHERRRSKATLSAARRFERGCARHRAQRCQVVVTRSRGCVGVAVGVAVPNDQVGRRKRALERTDKMNRTVRPPPVTMARTRLTSLGFPATSLAHS